MTATNNRLPLSRLLKKGTGSEPAIVFLGDSALRRGASPLFQQAVGPQPRIRGGVIAAACLLFFWGLLAAPARATVIVNVSSPPTTNSTAFTFAGSPVPSFGVGTNPATNGASQLTVTVNFDLPGGSYGTGPDPGYDPITNTTTFYECSLVLTGLAANGPAASFGGNDFQALGAGTFAIFSEPDDIGGMLLLGGSFGPSTVLQGADGSVSAFTSSTAATFSSGSIWSAASPSAHTLGGTASTHMSLTNGSFVEIGGPYLDPFTANGQQLYSFAPEPGSFVLLACGLAGLTGWGTTARRRRAKKISEFSPNA
jgi:hypothetical protein